MTIDEALRWLLELEEDLDTGKLPHYLAALKLGIEALKRIQWLRSREYFGYDSSLVGETED